MIILSRKYKAGHHSHDNMGQEYEVVIPLLFGYYWCREIGTLVHSLQHEDILA